jgi:MFS family permease
VVLLFMFFTAFNFMEASLPSLISRIAPAQSKGTAMGIYSSSQFLGAFSGGVIGGALLGHYDVTGVFDGCAITAGLWLLASIGIKFPQKTATPTPAKTQEAHSG